MITFTYTARDPKSNENVRGEIQADTESNAARILIEKGLAPLEIRPKQAKSRFSLKGRIPAKVRVIFSRQLSTMVSSGLPLVQSLSTVRDQTDNPALKGIISTVISDVEAGATLADSLGKYPNHFDDVYVSLIAAGEASGTLDVSLERLANQQEKDSEIMGSLRGALMYPLIVLVVLMAVVIFMMVSVLPQVQGLYSSLPGTKLPALTTMLISVSHIITAYWWLMLIVVFGGGFLLVRWLKTASGIIVMDKYKTKAPIVSPLFMKLYMARFARTGGTLVGSGVPLLEMLNVAARAVGNIHIENSIKKAAEEVKGGKALSDSLKNDKNFLPLVPNMIHIGEQSGTLETMLNKLAEYYEKELDTQIKSISTTIEPVLMVVVGVIALIIVAAVLMPIYSLAGKNVLGGG